MKKTCIFFLFIVALPIIGFAQGIQPFHKGDRISFLGNSITDGGHYHSYIWLYYMTRFPNERIEVFNSGIGGEAVKRMYDRLDDDVLSHHPNVIVLTFGMNDSDYYIYLKPGADTASNARIKSSYNNYLKLEKRLKALKDVRIILMTSPPFDETAKLKSPDFPGKNAAMLKINAFMEASAKKNNWEFIDLNAPMTTINQREQKIDSSFSLQGKGRIHPEEDGHMVMAYLFLKEQGLAGRDIADVKINTTSKSVQSAKYCQISKLSVTPSSVSFNYKAASLPYPLDTVSHGSWGETKTQADALKVIPFTKEFNREMLYVNGLKGDKYQLSIDGEKIGVWSGVDFANGINLALQTNTPQYQQSMAIMYLNEERWEIERRLRVYYWYQFDILREKGLLFKDNLASIDTLKSMASTNPFVGGLMQGYLKSRHPEVRSAWTSEMQLLTDKIYTINKPKTHTIEIKLINAITAQPGTSEVYKDSTAANFFRRTNGWIAGDGAFTVPLSDGRILWLMGDSHINDYDSVTHTIPCLFQVNNAAILQNIGDWNWRNAKTLIASRKGNKSFFRDTTDSKTYYWPVSGIQLEDTVYVYYNGITRPKSGKGFVAANKNMLVKIHFPEMEIVGHHQMQDFKGIGFGDGFVENKQDGFVYVYGYKSSNVYVARFPINRPTGEWKLWNGKSWSQNATDAISVGNITGKNTPMVCKVKNKYILVSSELSIGCDMGNRIYVSVAEKPAGPFSSPKAIYTIDDTLQGHYPFFYVPVAHPALINEKDELLITYNVNGYGKCIEGCVNNRMNPDHYRPRGIRVPLKLIDL